jgi:hypothetical protein
MREEPYENWDRRQWASEDPARYRIGTPAGRDVRWNKRQWVGDRGPRGRRVEDARADMTAAADMPEGDSALSGFRHNPGVQHWAHPATPNPSAPAEGRRLAASRP